MQEPLRRVSGKDRRGRHPAAIRGATLRSVLIWMALVIVVPIAGLVVGTAVFHGYRWLTQAPVVTQGDFSQVTKEVGAPVVLLSTTTCPWCAKTRTWLNEAGVLYRDCLTDVDPFARKLFEDMDSESVPVLVSATRKIVGFEPGHFATLVEEAGPVPSGKQLRCNAATLVVPANDVRKDSR